MRMRQVGTIVSWGLVTGFLLLWFGIVFSSVYASGAGETSYRVVRWLAGLGPE